ncbi:hypothetical protein [Comamonas endophytica]|uniref:Uncharacterized protein n=1 Tax=Comamonas endophytica TaxID=2949090 RepID=A0ABY6GAC7_9BURK|nr:MULTISPECIES: hypothetical protein [unclassified Acidovorax]MCD2511728.1 hypothetical protein [Acidovorax sp. D4N7]UYG51454.1 hypothetical protein M9799_15550 [Acidovorax sp. 5MLIR]
MNLPIQRQGPSSAWSGVRVEAGDTPARSAAAAGPGDISATDRAIAHGFFVAVGDGTQKQALAREAAACREAMTSALGAALLAAERSGHRPAETDAKKTPGTRPQATPAVVAAEVARQEKSLAAVLKSAFGKVADRAGDEMRRSWPKLMEKGVEFGLRKMTSVALQLGPGVEPQIADELAKIALPWVVSGAVNVGMAMKSHIEGLLERAAPSASPTR